MSTLSPHSPLCLAAILVPRLTCVGHRAWSRSFDLWLQTHDNEVALWSLRIYAHWIQQFSIQQIMSLVPLNVRSDIFSTSPIAGKPLSERSYEVCCGCDKYS